MAEKTALAGSHADRFGPESKDDRKAGHDGGQAHHVLEDSLPDCDLVLDMENTLVRPVDGVVIDGNDEEIKLYFYYYKPESTVGEDEVVRCKCVAELRTSRSHFISMMSKLHSKELNLTEQQKIFRETETQEQLPMFL
ncbi:MAG: hypothetical protein JW840_02910 [Candidatus Thermoplasmatota archaeon]|nr:hypothetical protein [Candidatus Thermoplasmatota archaeon]